MTRREKVMQAIKFDSELLTDGQIGYLEKNIKNGLDKLCVVAFLNNIPSEPCLDYDCDCRSCWDAEAD